MTNNSWAQNNLHTVDNVTVTSKVCGIGKGYTRWSPSSDPYFWNIWRSTDRLAGSGDTAMVKVEYSITGTGAFSIGASQSDCEIFAFWYE